MTHPPPPPPFDAAAVIDGEALAFAAPDAKTNPGAHRRFLLLRLFLIICCGLTVGLIVWKYGFGAGALPIGAMANLVIVMVVTCLFAFNQERVKEETDEKLRQALAEVQQLSGLLPICCHCKKVKEDDAYLRQVEEYVADHSDLRFSHGICPTCLQERYEVEDCGGEPSHEG